LLLQLWGLLIGAPSAHYWHMYLQRWFAGKAETLQTVLQKVALDQLTFGPLYNLAFMAYTSMVVNSEQQQQQQQEQQHWHLQQQQHQQD
jgi:peroxisomal membrane protein 2